VKVLAEVDLSTPEEELRKVKAAMEAEYEDFFELIEQKFGGRVPVEDVAHMTMNLATKDSERFLLRQIVCALIDVDQRVPMKRGFIEDAALEFYTVDDEVWIRRSK